MEKACCIGDGGRTEQHPAFKSAVGQLARVTWAGESLAPVFAAQNLVKQMMRSRKIMLALRLDEAAPVMLERVVRIGGGKNLGSDCPGKGIH